MYHSSHISTYQNVTPSLEFSFAKGKMRGMFLRYIASCSSVEIGQVMFATLMLIYCSTHTLTEDCSQFEAWKCPVHWTREVY